jgi:putative transposase
MLEDALKCWHDQRILSIESKQRLFHYIQQPEGLGVLKAHTSFEEETQFQIWLSE